jgi:hypothetical protein
MPMANVFIPKGALTRAQVELLTESAPCRSVPSLPDSRWARALPTPTMLVVQTD